jgi:hypothetical protein
LRYIQVPDNNLSSHFKARKGFSLARRADNLLKMLRLMLSRESRATVHVPSLNFFGLSYARKMGETPEKEAIFASLSPRELLALGGCCSINFMG